MGPVTDPLRTRYGFQQPRQMEVLIHGGHVDVSLAFGDSWQLVPGQPSRPLKAPQVDGVSSTTSNITMGVEKHHHLPMKHPTNGDLTVMFESFNDSFMVNS